MKNMRSEPRGDGARVTVRVPSLLGDVFRPVPQDGRVSAVAPGVRSAGDLALGPRGSAVSRGDRDRLAQ